MAASLPRRQRWLVGWALLAILMLSRLALRSVSPPTREPFAAPVIIDLNRATVPELMTLPGVGRRRAASIVLHRLRHGPFSEPAGLVKIDGFGAASLARLRPFLSAIPR